MANVLVGQPLDTIKVRLQLDQGKFKGAWDCAVQTVQKEGFFALYKGKFHVCGDTLRACTLNSDLGMASPLIGIGAVNALLFAANSNIKSRLQTHPEEVLSLDKIALAGAGAGIVNSILASPVELLKIKMQAQFGSKSVNGQRHFSGPIDCAKYLIQRDGVSHGLFRGMYATILREIPAYAGFYAGFEATKRFLTKDQKEEANIAQLMTAGAVGGIGYWTFCYPLDVVKSVVQNQEKPPRGLYVTSVMKQIYVRDGLGGLFRGFVPSVLRRCVVVFDGQDDDHLLTFCIVFPPQVLPSLLMNFVSVLSKLMDGKGTIVFCFILLLLLLYKLFIKKEKKK